MDFFVTQNTDQILSLYVSGDKTGFSKYYFTMKEFKLSPHRKVDITITTGTYDSGTNLTKFDIPLLPEHTQELTKRVYYYDFKTEESSTDRDLLDQGTIFLIRTVRRDSDIAPANTTNVLSLNPNDYPANTWFRVEDDGSGSNNIVIGKTDAEVKSALGLPKNLYVAKISESFSNEPVVSEISNSFGYTPYTSFSRTSTGLYTMLFDSRLTSYIEAQTLVVSLLPRDSTSFDAYSLFYFIGNIGKIETVLTSDFSTNLDFLNHILKIEVFT